MRPPKILNIPSVDQHLRNTISKQLDISPVLAQILINRGIHTVSSAEEFIQASPKHLLDPFSFKDMKKAVDIIKKAAKEKKRVMIYGDYDVDGITSTALLKDAFLKLGITADCYIPHRIKEGYGLNKNIISLTKQKKIDLLVTVDCGTNSHECIKGLTENKIEVVVTDHHEPSSTAHFPGSAIINPKLKDSGYKFRDLAGVGVAYKFCQALSGKLLADELDLVTLGTIADVVPLMGENRIIVKEGLNRLTNSKRPGVKALIEVSRIKDKAITAGFVSYILAPRLNASGRVDTALTALNLLLSKDSGEAEVLAKDIDSFNRSRQKIEAQILEEAQAIIAQEVNFKQHKVIVVSKDSWHQGVLGIVASKLSDKFYRPTILISESADKCKGSGRSIKNFHLFNALLDSSHLLDNFGGHSHAVGLVIPREKISDFRKNINKFACDNLNLQDLIPSIDIDMELSLSDLNKDLIKELEVLEPYGAANPQPLFYTKNLKLKSQPQVLKADTLKFWVTDGVVSHQVIGFRMASFKDSLLSASYLDLVYTPRIDSWQDDESIILEAEEIFFK